MKKMNRKKRSVGKVVSGLLFGSVVGAAVGWLSAPLAGRELRRKLAGNGSRRSVREGSRQYAQHGNPHPIPEVERSSNRRALDEKIKTSEGNVESQARDLAAELNEDTGKGKKTSSRRRKVTSSEE